MQYRYVRLVAVAAVAAIAATIFSACSTPGQKTGQKKTLTITDIYEVQWGQSLEAAAADYTKAHPDVTVKVQTLPYAGYQPALQTQFVGGAGPDIAIIEPPAITDFSARGFLAPLTSALDEKTSSGQAWRTTFVGNSVSSMRAQDGKEYTVPWSTIHLKVLYRPDIFKAAGINTYPATWDEFIKANQTLKDKGMLPQISGLAGNEASLWWQLTPMLEALYRPDTAKINLRHAKGWNFNADDPASVSGELYTADEKYVAFVNGITDPAKSPEYRKAIELILQLKPFIGDTSAFTPELSHPAFIAGTTPQMVTTQSAVIGIIAKAKKGGKDILVETAEQPSLTEQNWPGLTAGGVNPVAAVRNGFVVNAASKNKDLAIDFLKFITTPEEVTAIYAKGWSKKDPTVFTIGDPSTVTGVSYPNGTSLVDKPFKEYAQIPVYGFGTPPTYDQQDFDQFTSQFQKLFLGQVGIDEFLKERSVSNMAALKRNLSVYSSEVDQKFIDENTK